MPAISPPSQDEVDAVASFVEACAELDREPFFGPDEKRVLQQQGERITCILGDRFHFRSALISFRRIWMPSEPSHVHAVADILRRSNLSSLAGDFLQVLAVLRCSSTVDLLGACDAELRLVEKMPQEAPAFTKTFRGSTGVTSRNSPQWSRANVFEGPGVETDQIGLCFLDETLRLFKRQLVEE